MHSPLFVALLYVGTTLLGGLAIGYSGSYLPFIRGVIQRHFQYVSDGEALIAEDKRKAQEKDAKALEFKKKAREEMQAKHAVGGGDSESDYSSDEDFRVKGEEEKERDAVERMDRYTLLTEPFSGLTVYPTLLENVRARLRRVWHIGLSIFSSLNDKDVLSSLLVGAQALDKKFFFAGLLCTLATSVVGIFSINSRGELLNIVKDASLGQTDAPARAGLVLSWLFLYSALEMLLSSVRSYLYMRCETKGFLDLQRRYHRNALVQDASFYKTQGRELNYHVQYDVNDLKRVVVSSPGKLLVNVVDLIVGVGVCLWMDWSIALCLLLLRLPEALGVASVAQRYETAYGRLLKKDSQGLRQCMSDSIENVISVQNLGAVRCNICAPPLASTPFLLPPFHFVSSFLPASAPLSHL